jgi:hypothetical protein
VCGGIIISNPKLGEGDMERSLIMKTVSGLYTDVKKLERAFAFAVDVTRTALDNAGHSHTHCHVTVDYAAWVHYKFAGDTEKYTGFLHETLEKRTGRHGNTLFGFNSPERVEPIKDAVKLLDRIDFGLHFLKQTLRLELPLCLRNEYDRENYSVRNGGWYQGELVERLAAFVEACAELFNEEASVNAKREPPVVGFLLKAAIG